MKNTKILTITAMFMAINIALSSFGITVPGGHLYLNDVIIVIASFLLNPFDAFLVSGIGAFLGDFFFYPTPMFVSLVVHGLQAIIISILFHKYEFLGDKANWLSASIGALINIVGYTLGRTFVYANLETAMLKLPFQIFQAFVGVILGIIIFKRLKALRISKEKIYK